MIALIVVLAVVGFAVGLIINYVPMPQPFKYAIIGVAALACLFLVMRAFGIADIPLR